MIVALCWCFAMAGLNQAASIQPPAGGSAVELLGPTWTGKPPDPPESPGHDRFARRDALDFPARFSRRVQLSLNPAPFVSTFFEAPDLAPMEPRDGLFDARGALLDDGPNSAAFWRPARDLDVSASVRLDRRHHVMLGFSLSARGRFTPRSLATDASGPKLYFLQFGRRW